MPSSSGHRFHTSPKGRQRRGNPYFSGRRNERLGTSPVKNALYRLSPRFWALPFLIIFISGVLTWLFVWSNVFMVKRIEVRGANLIPASAIEQLAQERLEEPRAWIFPQSRLFVFNTQDFEEELSRRYAFEDIQTIKRLPSSLIITLTEKAPAAVWFEADSYYQIDEDGLILSISEGPVEGLPAIYNNGAPKIHDKQLEGLQGEIAFATELVAQFPERFPAITLKQLVVDNDTAAVKLLPEKGAMIYFSTKDSASVQLSRLEVFLASELKSRFVDLRYIDLRFGDRVYYQ